MTIVRGLSPWIVAAVICAAMGALEAAFAGKDPIGALRTIRQPRWAPPIWIWAIIGGVWYAICYVGLARLLPRFREAPWPFILLLGLMLANGAWGIIQFRMKRYDLGFLFCVPYAALAATFLAIVWPIDQLSFYLFAGYAIYFVYGGAWGWAIWRLNSRAQPPVMSR